jgi:hypothetical protein
MKPQQKWGLYLTLAAASANEAFAVEDPHQPVAVELGVGAAQVGHGHLHHANKVGPDTFQ